MSNSLEAKIVVLGSQGVGKTSLLHRFVFNVASQHPSTVGASFLTKRVVDVDSGSTVRLQIWDTAGQERFRSISKLYYRGANAALLCYDITSASSFTEMGRWLLELHANLPPDTIIHVVGTKADQVAEDPGKRQVPFERCIAYVAENLYPTIPPTPSTSGESRRAHTASHSQTNFFAAIRDGQDHDREANLKPAKKGHNRSHSSPNLLSSAADEQHHQHNGNAREPVPSPHSNRSSGLWNQDLGWDSCHEISSTSGEGVEEVFRVITKRLVDQHRVRQEAEMKLLAMAGRTPGINGLGGAGGDYFSEGGTYGNSNGSFRIGYGDKRRSWLGLPITPGVKVGAPQGEDWEGQNEGGGKKRGRCC